MIILLSIPLGILCLILAGMCLRVRKRRHASVCALIGLFFLALAAVMSYATNVLVQEIARTS
jgi:predicted PurR-regulated permease PerM